MVCRTHLARWFERSSALATIPAVALILGSVTIVFAVSMRTMITVGNDLGAVGGVAAGLPVCALVAAAALWHKLASETTGIQCCGGGNTNTTTGGGNQRCSCCNFTLGAMGLCKSSTVDLRLISSLR